MKTQYKIYKWNGALSHECFRKRIDAAGLLFLRNVHDAIAAHGNLDTQSGHKAYKDAVDALKEFRARKHGYVAFDVIQWTYKGYRVELSQERA